MSHQISFEIPKVFSFSQLLMDWFNKYSFQNFSKIFVPDYADPEKNLAWKLSHPRWIKQISHEYIGIISSFWAIKKEDTKEKSPINFLFTISGYLAQHRESFIKKLIEESKQLPGKKVFILGDTQQKDYYHYDEKYDIEIYGFLAGQEKIQKFLNAEIIVSRAWYTTIMDLVELEKPAILYPTPNQSEQLYLAEYLGGKNYFVIGKEEDNLMALYEQLQTVTAFSAPSKTEEAVNTIYQTLAC